MYLSLSDCAKPLKWEKICLCSSLVGVLGVGDKLSPLSSSSMSCEVSSNVLRLWIVRSDVCFRGAGIKKKLRQLGEEGEKMVMMWWLREGVVDVSLRAVC